MLILVFLLFINLIAVKAKDVDVMPKEEIAEAPSSDPISEETITYLLCEDIYEGTLSWQSNKVSTKFNYA